MISTRSPRNGRFLFQRVVKRRKPTVSSSWLQPSFIGEWRPEERTEGSSPLNTGGYISTWTFRPAIYENTQELLKESISSLHPVHLTSRVPHIFRTVGKKGILFHFWALILIVLFAVASNIVAARASYAQIFSVMETDAVVAAVQSIAPYTSHLTENPDQVRIAHTGDSFVGASTPGAMPQEYSHQIAKGETLATVADIYKVYVSDILKLNDIKPEDAARVKVGQVVRVPAEAGEQDTTWLQVANEARRRAEEEAARARLALSSSGPQTALTRGARGGNIEVLGKQSRGGNTYPYGWCTYWVASKRYVPPRWGNAKNWLNSARAAGWATGSEPRVGSIVVTSDNWFYGHVAYVEGVSDSSITISEMNYVRWGVANTRTIPRNSGLIRGYIY